MLLAILYNLELATFTLAFPFALIFVYGLFKKSSWVKGLLNKKIILSSFILPFLVMLPVIIYDFSNGFKQTVVFLGWTLYKPFSFLFHHSSGNLVANLKIVVSFGLISLQRLIFQDSLLISALLFVAGVSLLAFQVFKKRKLSQPKSILLFLLMILVLGILVNQIPSDAYLPVVLPFVIFSVAILFELLLKIKFLKYLSMILLIVIVVLNSYVIFKNDFVSDLGNRVKAVDKIIKLTNNLPYNLVGRGEAAKFRSFTMDYEYLLWWKGHPISEENVKTKIAVWETAKGIIIEKIHD
jgi:hypothetical protein